MNTHNSFRFGLGVIQAIGVLALLIPGQSSAAPAPATLSPDSLNFGNQTVGAPSPAKPITLTNNQTVALTNIAVAITGIFSQTNNCGTTLAAKASCTISVTFSPNVAGTLNGTVTVTYNASNSPQVTSLSGNGFFPGLASIAVTPANSSLPLGLTRQFKATGTYHNGTTADLTAFVVWSSSSTAIAAVTAGGLATSVAQGSTIITATASSLNGSTTLAVAPPALVSIAVTPSTPRIPLRKTQQFKATGSFTNSSTQDITASVTWTSSAAGIATIAAGGLATAVSPGNTIITAQSSSVSGTATLTPFTGVPRFAYLMGDNPSGYGISLLAESLDPATGLFTPITGSPFPLQDGWFLAVHPAAKALYGIDVFGEQNTGSVFVSSIDYNSGLTAPLNGSPFPSAGNNGLSLLATDPLGRFLYAFDDTVLSVFRLDPTTAAPTLSGQITIPSTSNQGIGNSPIAIDPTGHFLFIANWDFTNFPPSSGLVSVYAIDQTTGIPAQIPGSPFPLPKPPVLAGDFQLPQQIAFDPSGRFVYFGTTDGNLDGAGWISAYSISGGSSGTAAVTPVAIGTYTSGLTSALTVDLSGRFLYAATSTTITGYSIDPASGALTALSNPPVPVPNGNSATSVSVDPSGKFVYVTSTNGNGGTDHLTGYALNSATGVLTQFADSDTGLYSTVLLIAAGTSPAPALASLEIIPTNPAPMPAGNKLQFDAIGTFSDGSTQYLTRSVTWSSSNPSVANIANGANGGFATTYQAGTVTVTATLGALSASTALSVNPAVLTSISVHNPPSDVQTLPAGTTIQLTATASFSDGTTQNVTDSATWVSQRPNEATVSSSGLVTGLTAGNNYVSITASVGSVSGSFSVYATVPALVSVILTPTNAVIPVGSAIQVRDLGTFSDGSKNIPNVYTPGLEFSSSDTTVAAFDTPNDPLYAEFGLGVLRALAPGQATISLYVCLNAGDCWTVSTTVTVTAATPAAQFAYVTGQDTNSVYQFTVDPVSGALSPVAAAPTVPAGTAPRGIAVDPSGQFVYVANYGSGSVSAYKIGAGGVLNPISCSACSNIGTPQSIQVHPSGKFAYVVDHDANAVRIYTIDPAAGGLTPAQTISPLSFPEAVGLFPSGAVAYMANYDNGNPEPLNAFTVDSASGNLAPLANLPQSEAGAESTSAGTFDIAVEHFGRFLYVVGPSLLKPFDLDPNLGGLINLPYYESATYSTGVNPKIALDPSGKFLYVASSDPQTGAASIAAYAALYYSYTLLQSIASYPLSDPAAGLAIDPTGRFLYLTGGSTVSVYSINADSGALTFSSSVDVTGTPGSIVLTAPTLQN